MVGIEDLGLPTAQGVNLVRMNLGRQLRHRRVAAQRRKFNFGLESRIVFASRPADIVRLLARCTAAIY